MAITISRQKTAPTVFGAINCPRRVASANSGVKGLRAEMDGWRPKGPTMNPEPTPINAPAGDTFSTYMFTPPRGSLASRLPPLRSIFSARGALVALGRAIVFESDLERKQALVLLASGQTADLIDQPTSLKFVGFGDKEFSHTFDFAWVLKDGRRAFVYSKPAEKVARRNLNALVERMNAQLAPEVADGILLMTDEDINPTAVFNAELMHAARRCGNPVVEKLILSHCATQAQPVSIGALVALFGGGGLCFRPIIRLVAEGLLSADGKGRLGYGTLVAAARCGERVK
ncbi:hypothetical protein [Mesorhizobium sp. RIZ17]|uniref:hypothetical protein n=1 Tax=Mesorhizobium sp. RIZ17 TaxID=3132743 RepID=UPI003DA82604